jgi:hypothetical protein
LRVQQARITSGNLIVTSVHDGLGGRRRPTAPTTGVHPLRVMRARSRASSVIGTLWEGRGPVPTPTKGPGVEDLTAAQRAADAYPGRSGALPARRPRHTRSAQDMRPGVPPQPHDHPHRMMRQSRCDRSLKLCLSPLQLRARPRTPVAAARRRGPARARVSRSPRRRAVGVGSGRCSRCWRHSACSPA